jgi:hypothetical protein
LAARVQNHRSGGDATVRRDAVGEHVDHLRAGFLRCQAQAGPYIVNNRADDQPEVAAISALGRAVASLRLLVGGQLARRRLANDNGKRLFLALPPGTGASRRRWRDGLVQHPRPHILLLAHAQHDVATRQARGGQPDGGRDVRRHRLDVRADPGEMHGTAALCAAAACTLRSETLGWLAMFPSAGGVIS